MFTQAMLAFGLEEVPGVAQLASQTFASLKHDFDSLEGTLEAQGSLGTILKDAAGFESAEEFRESLSEKLVENVFEKTAGNLEQLETLGRALGKKVEHLQTAEGQAEAAQRLTTLVVTSMSKEAVGFRSNVVSSWLKEMQAARQTWEEVQDEANELLDTLFPNPQVREEVAASLRSVLLDPETKRAIVQGLLNGRDADGNQIGDIEGGWMGELDTKMQDIMKLEKPLSGGRKAVAQGRVNHLTDALVGLNTTLLPFLKAEPGTSQARDALFSHLDDLQHELELQELDVEKIAIDVGITQIQVKNAEITVEQQQKLLEAAGKWVKQMELGEERASLMSRVAEFSKLEADKLKDAKGKSSEAAAERAKAAEAQVRAAKATLDARQAHLQAALRRGAEASRIRTALDRPALARSLDIAGARANQARKEHAWELRRALRAYRELLRFYTSVGANELQLPERPDDLGMEERITWSSALGRWLKDTSAFGQVIVEPEPGEAIEWELTARQIRALTSPQGLRIVCQAEEEEDVRNLLSRLDASLWRHFEKGAAEEWRDVPEEWHTWFARLGLPLASTADYERSEDSVIIRSQVPGQAVKVLTYDRNGNERANWDLKEEIYYQVTKEGEELGLWEIRDRYALHGDYIVEGLKSAELRNGRVLGIFLTIPNPGPIGGYLGEGDYDIRAENLGLVASSDREVRLRWWRDQESLGNRLFLIEDENPWEAFKSRADVVNENNDPKMFTLQGLPLGGATKLRLVAKGSERFERVKLRLLYVHYEQRKTGFQVAAAGLGAGDIVVA